MKFNSFNEDKQEDKRVICQFVLLQWMSGMITYIKHPEKYRSTFETAVLRAPKKEKPSREIVNQTNVVTGIFVHATSQQCRIAVFEVRPV
jgi:hypothetical protein